MKQAKAKHLLVSALPLFVGGMIYILWRSSSLLMFHWFTWLGVGAGIDAVREVSVLYLAVLPGWILYSLPDAAWVSTGVLLSAAIWAGSESRSRHFWIFLAPTLAVGAEFAQLFHLLPGTFDPLDFIACSISAIVSISAARRIFAYGF